MKRSNFVTGFFFALLFVMFANSCAGFDGNVRDVAAVYFNLGNSYFKQKDYKGAEEAYKDAIALDNDYLAAIYNLVRVLLVQSKFDEAETYLNKLMSISPDNADVLETYGYLRYLQNKKEEAYVFYQQVLILDPRRQNSLFNSGLIMYELERYEEALEILTTYVEFYPEDVNGQLFMARTGMNFENRFEFFKYYSVYLEKKSDDLVIRREYLDRLFEAELFQDALAQIEFLLDKKKEEKNPDLLFLKSYILLVGYEDLVAGKESLLLCIEQGFSDKNKFASIVYSEDFLYSEEVAEILKEASLLISEDEYLAYLESLKPKEEVVDEEGESGLEEGESEVKDDASPSENDAAPPENDFME
ncbi:MAG: tetratricopeptide repeat protein [Spirochaetales bacterium]|nr:tetratricopeptide repeat protein [Spirochaetales bacterium]